MAIIGTFTAADNGYGGSVKTLTLNFRAKFVPIEKDNDKAPDYRIIAGARMRRRLEEDRAGQRSRISLGQARRSEFSGADLCLAGERRGRRQLQPDLVPPQRHLIHRDQSAPPLRRRGLFAFFNRRCTEAGKSPFSEMNCYGLSAPGKPTIFAVARSGWCRAASP